MKLETKQNSTKSDHALAAANIRRELRAAFPGITFRIHSKTYAGGDSVSIHWTLGPTTAQVETITNKYQEGSFNGMIDLYEYSTDRTFTAAHGSTKYVQTQRNVQDAYEVVAAQLSQLYNAQSAYELDRSVYRILAAHSFPANATITGVEHNPTQNAGLIEDIFRPTYTK